MKTEKSTRALRYGSAAAFGRAVAGYYDAITCRRQKTEWAETGELNARGKPILAERPMTDAEGRTLYETVYLTPPTLPGLLLYLGMDGDTWADCAGGVHGRGMQEVCRRAMLRQEAYLLETLLHEDRGTSAILSVLDRYHRAAEPAAAPDAEALLRRLALSIPLTEKLRLSGEDSHAELP